MAQIGTFPLLGETVNKWRQRNILLYAHPSEAQSLVSVGTTFDGALTVAAVEPRESWIVALDYASRGKVYVSE